MKKIALVLAVSIFFPSSLYARVWTDASGKYTIDANLIAFSGTTVVLQRGDHELGQIPIEKLSKADQEYLKSKEAGDAMKKVAGAMQTWTLRSDLKLVGRVVGYAHRTLTVERRGGNIYVNDRLFDNLPQVYQMLIPKIVAHQANLVKDNKQALEDWLVSLKGQPQTFTIEGVLFELEGGDRYVVPFFFFSDADQALLKPGYEQWLAAHMKKQYEQRDNQEFLVQSLIAARQQDQQIQQQIAQMQMVQNVAIGATQLWEVTLYPGRGTAGSPQWVTMPGINSRDASAAALNQYPGYVAGPVRKIAGY
jgi:hypothetical protein